MHGDGRADGVTLVTRPRDVAAVASQTSVCCRILPVRSLFIVSAVPMGALDHGTDDGVLFEEELRIVYPDCTIAYAMVRGRNGAKFSIGVNGKSFQFAIPVGKDSDDVCCWIGDRKKAQEAISALDLEQLGNLHDVRAIIKFIIGDHAAWGTSPSVLVKIIVAMQEALGGDSLALCYFAEDLLSYVVTRRALCALAQELSATALRLLRGDGMFGAYGALSYVLRFQFGMDIRPLPIDLPLEGDPEMLDVNGAFIENAASVLGVWVIPWAYSWQIHARLLRLTATLARPDMNVHPTWSILHAKCRESWLCEPMFLDGIAQIADLLLPKNAPVEEWAGLLDAHPLPFRMIRMLFQRERAPAVDGEWLPIPDVVVANMLPEDLLDLLQDPRGPIGFDTRAAQAYARDMAYDVALSLARTDASNAFP